MSFCPADCKLSVGGGHCLPVPTIFYPGVFIPELPHLEVPHTFLWLGSPRQRALVAELTAWPAW